MTPEVQMQLLERLLAHLEAGTTDMAPSDVVVPGADYCSPERFQREQQRLFRRLPLVLAHASEVAKPGDFLTRDDYGVPLLVTRDQHGQLHAFLNTCTHRGARLTRAENGCQKAFACPYHGWTFGGDGRLLNITHSECFPTVDKDARGLIRLPVQERFGFVWVVLDPEGQIDIDAYLGELAPELDALGLDHYVPFQPYSRPLAANWKQHLENFMETYHLPYTHSHLNTMVKDLLVVDRFGPHLRMVQAKHSLQELASLDRRAWRLAPHTHRAYFLFPNTIVAPLPDHVIWHQVRPNRVDESVVALTMLIPASAQGEWWQATWERCRAGNLKALEEDITVVETIGPGLHTGWLPELRIGRSELAIQHFRAVEARLTDGGEGPWT